MSINIKRPINELDFILAFCDSDHQDLNIPYEEVFIIIEKYAQLIRRINKSHSKESELKIAFKASSKGSLETYLKIIELAQDISQLPLDYKELSMSLLLAAQDTGIINSKSLSIFDFLLKLKGEKINEKQVKSNSNSNNLIIERNDGIININNYVFNTYNDPEARKIINEIGETITHSKSFESIEIRDPIKKTTISRIHKKDARYLAYNIEDDYDEITEHIDIVSIISSYFVGQSQWNFKTIDNHKFKAKITDLDWLNEFQKGKFSINTKFKLKVTINQKFKFVKNSPPKLVNTEISKIHEIIKPSKQRKLLE